MEVPQPVRDRSPEARAPVAPVALLAVVGAAVAFYAFETRGPALGALALVAATMATGLALQVRSGSVDGAFLDSVVTAGVLAVPAALVLYLSFAAGGFFPDATAFATIVLLVVLTLRATLAERPFAGFSLPLAVAAGALALYGLWMLASSIWSDAPARALLESLRVLVYLLALVLVGSVPRTPARVAWMLRGIAAALVIVAGVALATRLLPDVFPTPANYGNERLSYPLTYWNTLGMMAAFGAILCTHLSAAPEERWLTRILAAAALPLLATTLFFTFSRASILAGAAGLVAYLVLGRPRAALGVLVCVVPLTVVAVAAAYDADLLATADPTTAAAIAQGEDLAWIVALCVVGSALLRTLALPVDDWIARRRLDARLRRPVTGAAWAALIAVVVVATFALDVPGRVATQVDRFSEDGMPATADLRDRLSSASANGRIEHWEAGLRIFRDSPLHGAGAGAYAVEWTQERESLAVVDDAHSLYVEALADTGIVGFVLIVAVLVAILAALAPIGRGTARPVYAAAFAATLAWAIHAGVDWDWEMPALTLPVFALGGLALARRAEAAEAPPPDPAGAVRVTPVGPGQGLRVAVGLLAVLAMVGPALVFVSERRLDRAVTAFEGGDCRRAVSAATASLAILSIRPEPYEVLGLCQARRGFNRLAVQALERAVERDPENWEFRYGLALVRGAAGLDPRADARAALRLNPRDDRARTIVRVIEEQPRWQAILTEMARHEQLSVVR